jgi:hypothetical protein
MAGLMINQNEFIAAFVRTSAIILGVGNNSFNGLPSLFTSGCTLARSHINANVAARSATSVFSQPCYIIS